MTSSRVVRCHGTTRWPNASPITRSREAAGWAVIVLDVEGESKDLGKTAGKDAKAGKPTYPSLYGLDASRRLADERMNSAIAALADAGLQPGRLGDIATWVVKRTN